MQIWWDFSENTVVPILATIEQATRAAQELVQVLRNSVPKTPFTLVQVQLYSIYKLDNLFKAASINENKMQLPRVKYIYITVQPLSVQESVHQTYMPYPI